ncbi:hypothetical protein Val02_17060 [Virgisporangium aliadipatigenens]|uniref:Uncharacterized protein n=1 Tax=Virgisporangium aliadipatigenens TaxID=741659 RepID=A0A8J3YJ03_9ACTN|nr:DUF3824 domain-containing protein [Virgisporangium aliadipatigenens]GIJ44820.1 hypothetical protein Val02_17060 [Virgisporangium aliadipatigenens]
MPPSGGPFPPQGASFPPPGGYDPNAQPGYDPNAQPGYQQPGFQPGYDPNAQPGFQQPGFQPGYDPNAQQPFGAAPGAPLPPMTPPAGRGNKVKIVVAVVGALLLLCCIGGVVVVPRLLGGDALADAKQGDCLKGEVADGTSDKFKAADLELVDCGDSAATYVVAGKVSGKTQSEAETDNNVCAAYKDADTVFWIGPEGKKGTVLCLKAQ